MVGDAQEALGMEDEHTVVPIGTEHADSVAADKNSLDFEIRREDPGSHMVEIQMPTCCYNKKRNKKGLDTISVHGLS